MAKKHEKKTNAMRELDRIGAAYDTHIWDVQDARYCGKIRHPLCLHGTGC